MKRVTHTGDNLAKALLLTAILFYAPLAYSCLGENLPELVDASGSGTQKAPFLIGSFESLACIGRGGTAANGVDCSSKASWGFDAHYKLINNIDASRTRELGGGGWKTIIDRNAYAIDTRLRFRGSIDGNYHRITGLYVNTRYGNDRYFISVMDSSAGIKNLGLEELEITGGDGVAGLVGVMRRGTISNCYVKGRLRAGNVIGSGTNARSIGGLVGVLYGGGSIRNSYVEVSLSRGSGSNIIASAPPVGGLVGSLSGGSISNSYAKGSIEGACAGLGRCGSAGTYGGLVGEMFSGTISNSYTTVNFSELQSSSFGYTGNLIGELSGGNISSARIIILWRLRRRLRRVRVLALLTAKSSQQIKSMNLI